MDSFEPKLNALPEPQRRLWPELASVPPSFVLYGGTGLALRLGHRVSVDFDFFSSDPLDPAAMSRRVPFLRDADVLHQEPNTLTVSVPRGVPVKVSFFGGIDFGRVGAPEQTADGVLRVASLLDLGATTVKVLLQRVQAKDYIDVASLLRPPCPDSPPVSSSAPVPASVGGPAAHRHALTVHIRRRTLAAVRRRSCVSEASAAAARRRSRRGLTFAIGFHVASSAMHTKQEVLMGSLVRVLLVLLLAAAGSQAAEVPSAVRVTAPRANVRAQASTQAPVVASVAAGTVLDVSGAEGDWYAVSWTPTGDSKTRDGFIAARLVEAYEPAPIPAAETPAPTATPIPEETPAPETTLRIVEPEGPRPRGRREAGDRELLAFATLNGFFGGSSFAMGNVFFNYGKFLNPQNQVGGGPNITVSGGGGSTSLTIGFNGFYRRYFDSKGGQWQMYAGADLFVSDVSPDGGILDATYFQALGGAKNYLSEQLALDLKLSVGVSLGGPGSQLVQATFGFSYIF